RRSAGAARAGPRASRGPRWRARSSICTRNWFPTCADRTRSRSGPEPKPDTGVHAIASLPVILLGLMLGMRHALAPDHVIAVATIVTRERSPWTAGVIGALWGVGHTITIAVGGGAIILFGGVIPSRPV